MRSVRIQNEPAYPGEAGCGRPPPTPCELCEFIRWRRAPFRASIRSPRPLADAPRCPQALPCRDRSMPGTPPDSIRGPGTREARPCPEGPLSRVRERDRVRVSENDAPPQPRFAEESCKGGRMKGFLTPGRQEVGRGGGGIYVSGSVEPPHEPPVMAGILVAAPAGRESSLCSPRPVPVGTESLRRWPRRLGIPAGDRPAGLPRDPPIADVGSCPTRVGGRAAGPCGRARYCAGASGWFSGAAARNSGSARQASSILSRVGYGETSVPTTRATKSCGTRQRSARVGPSP